jgi:hypothetical protein
MGSSLMMRMRRKDDIGIAAVIWSTGIAAVILNPAILTRPTSVIYWAQGAPGSERVAQRGLMALRAKGLSNLKAGPNALMPSYAVFRNL